MRPLLCPPPSANIETGMNEIANTSSRHSPRCYSSMPGRRVPCFCNKCQGDFTLVRTESRHRHNQAALWHSYDMLSCPDQALFQENTTSWHCRSATQVARSTDKGNSMLPSIIGTENHATTDAMDMNDELLLGDVGMIDEGLETLHDYGSSDVDSDLDDEELESDSCEEVHQNPRMVQQLKSTCGRSLMSWLKSLSGRQ
jgi:hypothetical protein